MTRAARAQRVRVGAFMIAIAALVAIVLIAFGGLELHKHRARYRVVFSTSVFGLDEGSLVYLDGVQVGQVVGMTVDREDLGKVNVTIEVAPATPVRTDTTAELQLAGLTGLKVVELRGGSARAPVVPEGGTIAARESSLDRLARTADHLAVQADAMADKADRVLDNLVQITDPQRITSAIEHVRTAADDLAAASASARAMIDEDRAAVRRALADAGDTIAMVRGVVQANTGPIEAAVGDLRRASRSLADLARELRERPSRLLFSHAPRPRKLP